ncbi:MAG: DMT family transporter [Oscillospiraceae bacterium]|nr:DMT family transporter [Oscillospiraceae bacterium]
MRYLEKHPMIMIVVGILGISLSSILVKYSAAPAAVTAAYRMLWTVLFLSPVVFGKPAVRRELLRIPRKLAVLSALGGLFLAAHFVLWFESLDHTSVASSTTLVCTEVIWVSLGFCLVLKGKLSGKAVTAIAVTLAGSALIAYSDSGSGSQLYGDILALMAAMIEAVYTLIGREVRKHASTTVYTYLVYSACGVVLVATCLVKGEGLFDYGLSPVVVGALLAVFSTILGHSILSWCLKYLSASFVSASKLCEPVAAAVLAAFLFAEIPTGLQILGGALILGGVCWYSQIERKSE